MIPLEGNTKAIEAAEVVRSQLFEFLPQVLASPHRPTLNAEEQGRVLDKLAWLSANEHRAVFYLSVVCVVASLRPGTPDRPTDLTETVVKWARGNKNRKYREPRQRIGHSVNGRVIRDSKGL